jgi:hypothetical protein
LACSWDDKAYKYTVVESPKPKSINNLDQYVFIVRGRVGMNSLKAKVIYILTIPKNKKTKEITYLIDVRSFMLRDALRGVLHDVPGINILEEKLSVRINSFVGK